MRVENGGKQREDNFGLRNREPARRVGVRRTIANLKARKQESGEAQSKSMGPR